MFIINNYIIHKNPKNAVFGVLWALWSQDPKIAFWDPLMPNRFPQFTGSCSHLIRFVKSFQIYSITKTWASGLGLSLLVSFDVSK